MLRNARKRFRKSDESAYSIVPSRMSSRRSTSTKQTWDGASLYSDGNMSYRRLSFENDLFTAKVYKRSYRTPLIQRLFRRKVQTESDIATMTGPVRAVRSKSPNTKEHLIDGDETDRQITSPPNDRDDIPLHKFLDGLTLLEPKVGEVSELQPWPRIPKPYGGVTRQTPSDRAGVHRRKKDIKPISSLVPIHEDPTFYPSPNNFGRLFTELDSIIVGDDADYMNSKELRKVMDQDRRHLEKKRIAEGTELDRRLELRNRKRSRFRDDREREEGK